MRQKPPSPEQLDELIRLLGEPLPEDELLADQWIAAFAAAIDAALDTGVKLAIERLAPLFDRHRRTRPPLAAFLTLLDARVSAAAESPERATALFDAALSLATANHAESDSAGYLDWTPPGNLADRVRLEHERSVVAPRRTHAKLRVQLTDAVTRLRGIDAERWAAAMLLRRLALGLVPGDIVNDVLQQEQYTAAQIPTCEAHRSTPPLLVAAAHALAAAGDPTRALALLDERLDAATAVGNDKPTIVAVQRAKLAVMQRYRIDPGAFAERLLGVDEDHDRLAASRALALTVGESEDVAMRVISADGIAPPSVEGSADAPPWLALGSAPDEAGSEQTCALAEQALVSAEYLALAEPHEGGRLLGSTSSAFTNCGDPVGALIAGIAATLAAARRGARDDIAQALTVHVAKSHAKLVKLLGEGVLPSYAALKRRNLAAGAFEAFPTGTPRPRSGAQSSLAPSSPTPTLS